MTGFFPGDGIDSAKATAACDLELQCYHRAGVVGEALLVTERQVIRVDEIDIALSLIQLRGQGL